MLCKSIAIVGVVTVPAMVASGVTMDALRVSRRRGFIDVLR
jgi:hypothetical protein